MKMEAWKECKLGDICKTNINSYSEKDNWTFVNYLDTGNITENKISDIQFIDLSSESLPSRARRKVQINDIIYSTVRPNQKHFGIIKKQPENFLVSTGFAVLHINKTIADPNFVFYNLIKNENTESLHAIAEQTTSAYPAIKPSDIENLSINLPPLPTQQKIARILSSLDDKIELNNRINDNLEQMAQAIFKSWFVDFEPFGTEEKIESPIGTMIPRSLKMVQVADIPHLLETGKRPKGGAVAEGVPSIGAENVKQLGVFDFSSNKFIPREYADSLGKGKINGYELLLYKDGGKPGTFIPHFSMFGEGFPYDECYINEHVFKLDFYDKGLNEFAYFYFNTEYVRNWLANNGGKAAIPGINQNDVNAIWIYDLENPKVKEFAKFVEPLFKQIFSNCKQNRQLSIIRDTLLPKLMSGKLDVSAVEI